VGEQPGLSARYLFTTVDRVEAFLPIQADKSAANDKLFIVSLSNLDRLRFGELSSGGLIVVAQERKQSSSAPCSHHRDLDKCRATRCV
jgi:hypothetical protein